MALPESTRPGATIATRQRQSSLQAQALAPNARLALATVLPLALFVAWTWASAQGLLDPRIYPAPEVVWAKFASLWGAGEIGSNLRASLLRMLAGFAIGGLIGLGLGAVLGLSLWGRRLIGPSFNAFKQVAQMAWVPLICMWFGFAESSKIIFVALSTVIPVTLNAAAGFAATPKPLREVAQAYRLGGWTKLRKLYIPSALPSLTTGLQLGLTYAWLGAIGAEYFMSTGAGIGGLLVAGGERFDMAQVVVGILIMGIVGFAINVLGLKLVRVTQAQTGIAPPSAFR